jgi:hypothetical protein
LFRLNHKNIRSSWIPVKLVDVLSDVAPELAMQIAQLEHGLGMRTAGQSHSDEGRNRIEAAVVNFGVSLASEYSHLITPQELSEGLPKQVADIGYASGVETRRQMFQAMADYVTDRFHFTPDPTTAARPLSQLILRLDSIWTEASRWYPRARLCRRQLEIIRVQ